MASRRQATSITAALLNLNQKEKKMRRRIPAEWEEQKSVWLAWPHDNLCRGYLAKLNQMYLHLTEIMRRDQLVRIAVAGPKAQESIECDLVEQGIGLENIQFYTIPTNDVWIRDYGPMTVLENGRPILLNANFNGYGNRVKYRLSDQVPSRISDLLRIQREDIPITMEWGNVESNGNGKIMLCRSAVLNPNRNRHSEAETEVILKRYTGASEIIWLSGQKTTDEQATGWVDWTDTHVDTICRFVSENMVVMPWTKEIDDPVYPLLSRTKEELKERGLTVVELPVARFYSLTSIGDVSLARKNDDSIRTDSSYCNFVITNGSVIVPAFGVKEDNEAVAILRELFPGRKIERVFAGFIAENGGEFHCITMQEPAY